MATTNEEELKQILRDMNERVARQHFAVSLLPRSIMRFVSRGLKVTLSNPFNWMGIGDPAG